jgi:eukaryotic-like serine/threonine-protein kinase
MDPDEGTTKLHPGLLISGKYRLLRLLGAGGMGSVWAARNELTDRDFAIKFLLPSLAQNKEALHRFFHEARACGQIKHPAVVDVYDMGQAEDASPYLVMELLEGEGFDQRLARSGTFRPGEAAAWLAFISRGLEEAHVRGLVHRDLKPGNIFFALDDRGDVIPKVLDFGVSKATAPGKGDFVKTTTGAVLGSPAYMSPEQAKGENDIDGRSDVWSLGVILYETLTGSVPFDAPNYNALMLSIITRPHRPAIEESPGVPAELSSIIDRCLTKERSQRIGTARELAELLEAAAAMRNSGTFPGVSPRVPTLMPGPSPYLMQSIPPPPGMPSSTTQGPWADGRPTQRMRRRSSSTLVGVAMLLAAVTLGGLLAFLRLRPPLVAFAGRSSVALMTSMARVHQSFAQMKAEAAAAADERAKEAAAKSLVLQPSDLPPVTKALAAGPAASASASATRPKGKSSDPHGGVDSAGF